MMRSWQSSATPDEDKPDPSDGGERKNNRACDFCHRMKMKCIGKENPPCNRCRQSRQECTFDGPRKSKASKVEDRLKELEEQMAVVQSSLSELMAIQRSGTGVAVPENVNATVAPSTLLTPAHAVPQPSGHWAARTMSHERGHTPKRSFAQRSSPPIASSAPLSDDEDDPLEPSAVIYNNMLSLAEAARLKADGHVEGEGLASAAPKLPTAKRTHPFDYDLGDDADDDGGSRKRPRLDDPVLRRALPTQRGDNTQFRNPVEMGFCTPERGRELFNLFMEGGQVYVPIFDPATDTWDSLCRRSPFAVTALVMVGCKIADAGGPPSELQRKCRDHAEMIAMHTLFTPVARIEVLQAMIVLASWGDTSWRPGGHALRIAMDMGLYRCLPYLAQTGMGKGKTPAELEEERPMVVGARLWLALYKSEFEMAFNLGRPALFAAEDTIKHARKFLEHPFCIRTDSRLVATCELLTHRLPLHQPFSIWPSGTRLPNLDEKIEEANEAYATWYKHWEDYYESAGEPKSSFLRESLLTQYSHALLHTNSRILHGVRSRRDMSLLSEHRAEWLRQALRSAQTLVTMALRGEAYATNFAKANYYTHVGVAFAARMVIRLTSLMPDAVDLKQTGRDLEDVTNILAQVPGFQFAHETRAILKRARQRHVLPPASRGSPTSGAVPLPGGGSNRPSHGASGGGSLANNGVGSGFGFESGVGDGGSVGHAPHHAHAQLGIPDTGSGATQTTPDALPLDFFLAEQLFASSSGHDDAASLFAPPDALAFDAWFPYPPLEAVSPVWASGDGAASAAARDDASGGAGVW